MGIVSSGLKTFHLKYARPDDVMPILTQMLEIPEGKNVATDGSIRIAQEALSDRLLVSGRPDKVARAMEIIEGSTRRHRRKRRGTQRLSATGSLSVERLRRAVGRDDLAVGPGRAVRCSPFRRSQDGQPGRPARPAQQATIRATLDTAAWGTKG